MSEFRTGIGWDSHRTAPDRPLILGGVRIESDLGLSGHSDADVLAHAITDAMLGAAAQGDIGMHFSDTDPQWKDADSLNFLHHALQIVRLAGFDVVNVDSTVVIEKPKMSPHRSAIRERLAGVLGLPVDRVSVKFKTAEGLGPVGERRSVEAQAAVTVVARRV
ncbi:MAG: 2-C-methyl-D-erythritol 2,4-cyclodiphosphate synthase [Bryobacteraceae bacterium]